MYTSRGCGTASMYTGRVSAKHVHRHTEREASMYTGIQSERQACTQAYRVRGKHVHRHTEWETSTDTGTQTGGKCEYGQHLFCLFLSFQKERQHVYDHCTAVTHTLNNNKEKSWFSVE